MSCQGIEMHWMCDSFLIDFIKIPTDNVTEQSSQVDKKTQETSSHAQMHTWRGKSVLSKPCSGPLATFTNYTYVQLGCISHQFFCVSFFLYMCSNLKTVTTLPSVQALHLNNCLILTRR